MTERTGGRTVFSHEAWERVKTLQVPVPVGDAVTTIIPPLRKYQGTWPEKLASRIKVPFPLGQSLIHLVAPADDQQLSHLEEINQVLPETNVTILAQHWNYYDAFGVAETVLEHFTNVERILAAYGGYLDVKFAWAWPGIVEHMTEGLDQLWLKPVQRRKERDQGYGDEADNKSYVVAANELFSYSSGGVQYVPPEARRSTPYKLVSSINSGVLRHATLGHPVAHMIAKTTRTGLKMYVSEMWQDFKDVSEDKVLERINQHTLEVYGELER